MIIQKINKEKDKTMNLPTLKLLYQSKLNDYILANAHIQCKNSPRIYTQKGLPG